VDADTPAAWVCCATPVFAWNPPIKRIGKEIECRENTMRTERLFLLLSLSGINLKKTTWSTSMFRKALNKLTVEYITKEVGLLGVHHLLWPALRPFSK
jgi:hypothetical protein